MSSLRLTKEIFEWIDAECEKFREGTRNYYDIYPGDVLFSYFHSTPDNFVIFNDWDEGKPNDPFWNEELNEHSAIVFLKQMVKKLNELK